MKEHLKPSLLESLSRSIGAQYVLTSPADTAPYLQEQRGMFSSECIAVIQPKNTHEVSACVKICANHQTSMVPIGGNTGLCGGAVSRSDQIVIAIGRLNRIRELDTGNYSVTVEAGCILANIQQSAAAVQRLFPLSLGAEGSCQIGGNLATNAGGINVLHYGNARDLCLGIEAVLPDGSVFSDLGGLRKDNTGYALKHLFIGAEGTLGIITAATLKLFPTPREMLTALVALPALENIIPLYNLIRDASNDRITTFELIPRIAVEFTANHFPDQPTLLGTSHPWQALITLQSSHQEEAFSVLFSDTLAQALDNELIVDALIAQNIKQSQTFMALREKLVEAQRFEGVSIKHDISVPLSRIYDFISRSAIAVEKICPGARPYPFGHIGDGNIHYNISQPAGADANAFGAKRSALNKVVLDIVHELGGSFSAEHGIGILKTDLIPFYKGKVALAAMRAIKNAIDPNHLMNPGKVIGD